MSEQEKIDLREHMDVKFSEVEARFNGKMTAMEERLNRRIDNISHWQIAIATIAGIILAGYVAHYFDLLSK